MLCNITSNITHYNKTVFIPSYIIFVYIYSTTTTITMLLYVF